MFLGQLGWPYGSVVVTASASSSWIVTAAAVVLDGTLEVIIEDQTRGSLIHYFLITSKQRITLHFRGDPPNLLTGTRVRAHGVWQPNHVFLVDKIDQRSGD